MKDLIQLYTYNLILQKYIEDLEDQNLSLEVDKKLNEWLKGYFIPKPNPYIPNRLTPAPDPWHPRTCVKCGLKLEGVMGYCCPDMQCPTGMGPVMC